jgi:hypothetical protein
VRVFVHQSAFTQEIAFLEDGEPLFFTKWRSLEKLNLS